MAEYIERDKALEECDWYANEFCECEYAIMPLKGALEIIPAADVVSRGAFDQTDWERCVALTQLKEIGKSLGERMDDVRPVVLCRDCKHSEPWYADKSRCFLWHESGIDVFNDGFCNYGEKREES